MTMATSSSERSSINTARYRPFGAFQRYRRWLGFQPGEESPQNVTTWIALLTSTFWSLRCLRASRAMRYLALGLGPTISSLFHARWFGKFRFSRSGFPGTGQRYTGPVPGVLSHRCGAALSMDLTQEFVAVRELRTGVARELPASQMPSKRATGGGSPKRKANANFRANIKTKAVALSCGP